LKATVLGRRGRGFTRGLLIGMVSLMFAAQARAVLPLQMNLELGFEGRYRIGTWTPLRVLLENQGRLVEGTLLIKNSRKGLLEQKYSETVYSLPVSLPHSSRKLYQINVLLESHLSPLKVLLVAGGKTLLKREIPLKPFYGKKGFILVTNRTHSGFDFLNPVKTKGTRRVLYADLKDLPEEWIGYDAIQALILDDVTSIELTRAQQEAIKVWLSTGGTLVVTAKGGYGKFKSPLLLDLLPFKNLEKTYLSSSFSSLEDRYGTLEGAPSRIELWKSQWHEGEVLIEEKGIPLLVRLKKGQGRIFFLAIDSSQPPFRDWSGTPRLWDEMLRGEIFHLLFPRGSLESVVSHSFSWQGRLYPDRKELTLFLLSYLFLFGFFSWQATKGKFLGKWGMGLSVVIILFISMSYLMGERMREKNTSLRQVSIIYQKQGGRLARTESYLVLFSPYPGSTELKFDEKNCFVSSLLASQGERVFNNLVVWPGEGKIRWSLPISPPWSFYLFRLETTLPFSLRVRTNGEKEGMMVSLENLNSFSLEDILLLYNGKSSFLRDLPSSGKADLSLKRGKEFTPSTYLREITLRNPGPETELRKQVFQQIWDFGGPLKELSTSFPVVLAWFGESPRAVVTADRQMESRFTGLLIMPLEVS